MADRIESINVDRIDWLCQDRGIDRADLAKEIGIAESTLNRLFEGEGGLTFNQLQKLAGYFDQGVLFFLEPSPIVEANIRSPAFRTLMHQKPDTSPVVKGIIRRAETQRELYISLREQLDMPVPRLALPQFSEQQTISQKALAIRQWLGLRTQSNFDMYRSAIESKDILIFRSNGYPGKWQIPKESPVLGFSLYFERCPLIFVRRQEPEERQTFTLMHELGHLVLHKASAIDDADDIRLSGDHARNEKEASKFAGNLLVTDDHLERILDADRPKDVRGYRAWLQDIRRAIGVSTDVLLHRLVEVDRLPRGLLDEYYEKNPPLQEPAGSTGFRMYRYREPRHIFGDPFVRTVVDALSARRITLTRASRYLDGLKLQDVHKLEQFSAGL